MKTIDKDRYINIAVKQKYFNKRLWHTSIFGIHELGFTNEYVTIAKEGVLVAVDGELHKINDYKELTPLMSITDVVLLDAGPMDIVTKERKVVLGNLIINFVLINHPFQGKVPYIEDIKNLGTILDIVKNALVSDVITVAEYRIFVTACTFLETLSKLFTPSTTEKLMIPPPGLKAFKKELKEEFDKKYGKDWSESSVRIVAFDAKLKEHYADYIKDDASDGVLANKKHMDNALVKKYLTFSATNAFGEQVHIEESLLDGYPKDPEKLAGMFNTIRSASYSRGNETQKGGSVAKNVLRATTSIKIVVKDCGSKVYSNTVVTSGNYEHLVGRYILVNKKIEPLTLETAKQLVNKSVMMRTPMGCRTSKPDYCSVCCGKVAAGYPNGVALIVTNISSVLTKSALKAMHNSQISAVKVNIHDMLF